LGQPDVDKKDKMPSLTIDCQDTFSFTGLCGYTCSGTKGKFELLWKLHKKKCQLCNKREIGSIQATVINKSECHFKKFNEELARLPF